MRRRIAAAAVMVVGMSAGVVSAQVYLRGQSEALAGEVVKVGAEGVEVRVGPGTKTVSWDRVREVRGEHGAEAASFAVMADQIWRARTRLERGDLVSAEPLLDSLVDRARGMGGPTSAVVFEGLLRSRLKRGAQISAVWAWLDWIKARGGGIDKATSPAAGWIGGRVDAPQVIDEETGLITSLPPVFLRDAALDAAAGSDEWKRYQATEGGAGGELAMLYRGAVRFEAGLAPEIAPVKSALAGVRLVAEMVRARVGEEAERKEARDALTARLGAKDLEPWVECWCRVGIGRSLLREQDADVRRQGVIELLHAPARFSRVSPALAAIALAESAVALHEMGEDAGAEALKGELMDRYPRSAASGWGRLREVRMRGESPTPPAQGGTPAKAEDKGGAGTPAPKSKDGRHR